MKPFESLFLKLIGFSLIGIAVYQVFMTNIPAATLCAAIGVLLLFLARFSQFKRFKGWGFEAEMWEEKQEEATKLLASMKKIAALNSREIILNAVTSGRFGSGKRWKDTWNLFDEIKEIQGGVIEDSVIKEIKKRVDDWFLRDMISAEYSVIKSQVSEGCEKAMHHLSLKTSGHFAEGDILKDKSDKINSLNQFGGDILALASKRQLSSSILNWWADAKNTFANLSVVIDVDPSVLTRLSKYEFLESLSEVPVSADLINAADR